MRTSGYVMVVLACGALYAQPDMLPELALPDSSGVMQRLGPAENEQMRVINFWAAWCTACAEEIPELHVLQARYGQSGVHFVAVNAGEKMRTIEKFVRKHRFKYQILLDSDKSVARTLGILSLPQTLVVAPDGRILYRGARPPSSLSAWMKKK